jgi:ABC-type Fe3+ transport system substrate-binding protein
MLQEMKAGSLRGQDITDMAADFHNEYPPYQKKFDILGMAEQKVLQIPAQMVDPTNRNIVAIASGTQGIAYNGKLIAADKLPDAWEDFLTPELSDRKFMADTRPRAVLALIPTWGLERALDFARKLAAQKPVWVNGQSRAISSLLAGESALFFGGKFDSVLRAKGKDVTNSLGYKLLEPVPVRIDEPWSVLNTAEHAYAALLWLEFVVSPEGQKVLDEYGPYEASVLIRGTAQEQASRGKRLSLLDWQHYGQTQQYQEKIIKAFGFPRADR